MKWWLLLFIFLFPALYIIAVFGLVASLYIASILSYIFGG